ncbi:MAG: alanine racemase, partial [Mycobacteriales bacterium]
MLRAEASVDLDAIRSNVSLLCSRAPGAQMMAVVKADGYGHGLLPSARAAIDGGARWLGVSALEEALSLRAAGISVPILSWLNSPGEPLHEGVAADVDLSVSSLWALDETVAAARRAGRTARVHLKVDTGLSRNGATAEQWPDLTSAAAKAESSGEVSVVGVWTHLAYADDPGHPTIARQVRLFGEALDVVEHAGLHPQLRHVANSAVTLTLPEAHFDLVRPGIAVYGLSPVPQVSTYGLRPAMTLRGAVALAKDVPAGTGVSYGHQYTTDRSTRLALVP